VCVCVCVCVCDLETSRMGAPDIYIYDISRLRVKGSARVPLCTSVRCCPTAMRKEACFTFLAQNIAPFLENVFALSENVMVTLNQTFFYLAEYSCFRLYRLPVTERY
jgi:hypothetical protein